LKLPDVERVADVSVLETMSNPVVTALVETLLLIFTWILATRLAI
jgi:hypothetical protein